MCHQVYCSGRVVHPECTQTYKPSDIEAVFDRETERVLTINFIQICILSHSEQQSTPGPRCSTPLVHLMNKGTGIVDPPSRPSDLSGVYFRSTLPMYFYLLWGVSIKVLIKAENPLAVVVMTQVG